jgi:hypothetical protein
MRIPSPSALGLGAGLLLCSARSATAQFTDTLTSGCFDQTGHDNCVATINKDVTASYNFCVNNGTSTANSYCTAAASCQLGDGYVACALEYCWNKVYSCEYQQLLINYVQSCISSPLGHNLPFWNHTADDMPGACSCDLTGLQEYLHEGADNAKQCNVQVGINSYCSCCGFAETVAECVFPCPR